MKFIGCSRLLFCSGVLSDLRCLFRQAILFGIYNFLMRAIVIKKFGGLDGLAIENLPDPKPAVGQVLIQVKGFGINHAETHMRRGEWAEAAPVSGIECVGIVKECPGGEFAPGTKVVAFMGGMGRTINGSYA